MPSDETENEEAPDAAQLKVVFSAAESNFKSANDEDLNLRLSLLEQEHRDLDAAIEALASKAFHDRLRIARLKKKKLKLKDEIKRIRDKITPDIIA